MSTKRNISSYDISLLRKYISKTLSDEETYLFNAFLNKNPEYKEIVDGLTLADLDKIERISRSSVYAVNRSLYGKKFKLITYRIVATLVLVFIGRVYWVGDSREISNKIAWEEGSKEHAEIKVQDTNFNQLTAFQKIEATDTFYYVNTDEAVPEVAIEFIEEKKEEHKDVPPKQQIAKADSLPQSETMIADYSMKMHKTEKAYAFNVSLDYRQSLAVENDYAQAYKVGQTKSFAGQVGGYEYDPKGMPHYGNSETEFYNYLASQLTADTLLAKISKKMEAKVSFEVNSKGKVEQVHVVKCNHKQLCMKLTDIFEGFPDWQPADFKGKKGSVHYVIRVSYE